MSRILLLSNWHCEDLSGSLLAQYLVKSGDFVEALPIVVNSANYKKNIRIVYKTKEFSTGGIGYDSLREEWLKYCDYKGNYLANLFCRLVITIIRMIKLIRE